MSAEPAFSARQRLHEIIASVTDQEAEALLARIEAELAPPMRLLTAGERARLGRSLARSGIDEGLSTAELCRRLGMSD